MQPGHKMSERIIRVVLLASAIFNPSRAEWSHILTFDGRMAVLRPTACRQNHPLPDNFSGVGFDLNE